MSIYSGDQPTITAVMVNGVLTNMTAAQLKAASPVGTVYTFSQFYSFHYRGTILEFRPSYPYCLDAALKAALMAASAPMTAA